MRPSPRERAAWEWPLYAPYRAVRWPFSLLMDGAEYGVAWMDEHGTVERLRRLFGAVDLPYGFRVSGIVTEAVGKGVGADFYHDRFFAEGNRMQLKTQLTTGGRARVIFGLRARERKQWSNQWVAAYRFNPRAHYFAPGAGIESEYTQEQSWGGGMLTWDTGATQALQFGVVASQVGTRTGDRHEHPSIEDPEAYAGREPYGYREITRGVEFSVGWLRDTTRQSSRPTRGSTQRLMTGWFAPSTDDPALWTSRLETQSFWPLWYRRALALRLVGAWVESGDREAHFARLYTNDDPDQLRGFADFRFRGHGMLLWNLEYRYPIWAYDYVDRTGLDFYLFQDGGQFFDRPEQIGLRAVRFSHGFGVRFVGARGFGARFEVGYGGDGPVVRLSTDQVFQYARHGLFHGRPQIPLR